MLWEPRKGTVLRFTASKPANIQNKTHNQESPTVQSSKRFSHYPEQAHSARETTMYKD